jgi:hypothetical protein
MIRLWLAVLWTWWWAAWVVTLLFVAVTEWTGFDPARDYGLSIGAVVFAAIAAGLASTGVHMIRRLRAVPASPVVPVVEAASELPRLESAAYEPMVRLAEAEAALTELLRRLAERPGMSTYVIDHLWHTATDSAARLRSVAADLDDSDDDTARDLRSVLDHELDSYCALIATAGHMLLLRTPQAARPTE